MEKIGIVILNYKTWKDTIRLAKDLLNFSFADNLHIVIVDNDSPNDSYKRIFEEFCKIKNVHIIQSGFNGGYAKGNNIGLKYLAQYNPDFVLILNNDIYITPNVISACIENYNKIDDVGIISPIQQLPNGQNAPFKRLKCNTFLQDLLQYSIIYNKLKPNHTYTSNTKWKNIQQTDIIPGCFLFVKYSRFKEINFFYPGTFLFCEERFLYQKFKGKGYQNYTIIDQFYIHDHSHTIKTEVSHINQLRLLNNGYIQYTKQYRSQPQLKVLILKIAFRIHILMLSIIAKLHNQK